MDKEQIRETLDLENMDMEKENFITPIENIHDDNDENKDNKDGEQANTTIPLNPPVFSSIPQKHCGIPSTYIGSYWKMVCTAKDQANPLRSKPYVDPPKTRYGSYSLMNTEITDLEVRSLVQPLIEGLKTI